MEIIKNRFQKRKKSGKIYVFTDFLYYMTLFFEINKRKTLVSIMKRMET